jgi:hypothetical protein
MDAISPDFEPPLQQIELRALSGAVDALDDHQRAGVLSLRCSYLDGSRILGGRNVGKRDSHVECARMQTHIILLNCESNMKNVLHGGSPVQALDQQRAVGVPLRKRYSPLCRVQARDSEGKR